jgi:hypothetical protein
MTTRWRMHSCHCDSVSLLYVPESDSGLDVSLQLRVCRREMQARNRRSSDWRQWRWRRYTSQLPWRAFRRDWRGQRHAGNEEEIGASLSWLRSGLDFQFLHLRYCAFTPKHDRKMSMRSQRQRLYQGGSARVRRSVCAPIDFKIQHPSSFSSLSPTALRSYTVRSALHSFVYQSLPSDTTAHRSKKR